MDGSFLACIDAEEDWNNKVKWHDCQECIWVQAGSSLSRRKTRIESSLTKKYGAKMKFCHMHDQINCLKLPHKDAIFSS